MAAFFAGQRENYFGIWWEKQGGPAELIPPEFGRLSFKPNGDECVAKLPAADGVRSERRIAHGRLSNRQISHPAAISAAHRRQASRGRGRRGVESRPEWNGFVRRFQISNLAPGTQASLALPPADSYGRWTASGGGLKKIAAKESSDAISLVTLHTTSPHGGVRAAAALDGADANWQCLCPRKPAEARHRFKARRSRQTDRVFGAMVGLSRANRRADRGTELNSLLNQPIRIADEFPAEVKPPAPQPAVPAPPVVAVEQIAAEAAAPAGQSPVEYRRVSACLGKFVRMNILATENHEQPGIDEFEIFGADPKKDLAIGGKATASSVIQGYKIHTIPHLNDGIVGNEHSWIGGEKPPTRSAAIIGEAGCRSNCRRPPRFAKSPGPATAPARCAID